MTRVALGTFGGPGGWAEACRALGIEDVGIELDASACATRRAAGHHALRADVSRFPVEQLAGKTWGQTHSPPCTTFSAAGDQAGSAVLEMLAALTRDVFAGQDTRAAYREVMAAELTRSEWASDLDPEKRAAKIGRAVVSAALVAEPARFITAGHPEWVAMEQVPAVLPLWQVYAAELRKRGYSAWCGKLNAADYGVPQTRERAILIASRVRQVARPEPTHYDPRKGHPAVGHAVGVDGRAHRLGCDRAPGPRRDRWRDRDGWRGAVRPPGGREALEAERDAGRWALQHRRAAQRARSASGSASASASAEVWPLRRGDAMGPAHQPGPAARWQHGRPPTRRRARARADSKIRWAVDCQGLPQQQQQQRVRTVN